MQLCNNMLLVTYMYIKHHSTLGQQSVPVLYDTSPNIIAFYFHLHTTWLELITAGWQTENGWFVSRKYSLLTSSAIMPLTFSYPAVGRLILFNKLSYLDLLRCFLSLSLSFLLSLSLSRLSRSRCLSLSLFRSLSLSECLSLCRCRSLSLSLSLSEPSFSSRDVDLPFTSTSILPSLPIFTQKITILIINLWTQK